jgi:hypothetical protein
LSTCCSNFEYSEVQSYPVFAHTWGASGLFSLQRWRSFCLSMINLFSWIITINESSVCLYFAHHRLHSGVKYLIYVATVVATGNKFDHNAARHPQCCSGQRFLVTAADGGERPYLMGMMADVDGYVWAQKCPLAVGEEGGRGRRWEPLLTMSKMALMRTMLCLVWDPIQFSTSPVNRYQLKSFRCVARINSDVVKKKYHGINSVVARSCHERYVRFF